MENIKQTLATCCRLLEANGLIDFSGHVSFRDGEDTFLINSHGKSRFKVGPEDMVAARLDGTPAGKGYRLPSEIHIHSSILRARRDARAVAHLHSPAVISLSIARQPIFPAIFQGTLFADGIPVYDDARHVNTPARGDRLATALGNAKVVVIRGHGSVVVAEDIKTLFFFSMYFEKNARRLLEGYHAGNPEPLSAKAQKEGSKVLMNERIIDKVWDYYNSKIPSQH
jgi:ribulose-5-phosphate 4-epimerase/fuculose-1-phosphate aldolase